MGAIIIKKTEGTLEERKRIENAGRRRKGEETKEGEEKEKRKQGVRKGIENRTQ